MTADIHLTALYKEKKISRGKKAKEKARMRDGGECVIMVTKTTACRPVGKGGAWRKVMQLRYNQLNQL